LDPVTAAASFSDEINALAASIESGRRVPQELADKMAKAGLFRLLVPAQYGGLECSPQTFFDTLVTTAHADGATGWCLMIGTTTGLLSASLPPAWAQKIYGDHPETITVGVTAPIGRAEVSEHQGESGLDVTGRWPFASGCQVADWICGGCTVTENGEVRLNKQGQPEPILVFFPAEEVTIHDDTWDTSGLRGTGSHDIEVVNGRVPEGRWVVLGNRAQVDGPLYRFPTFGLLALGVSAVSIGIAQRAIDEFIDLAGSKTPTGSTRSLANRPAVQKDLAQAQAKLASAKALTQVTIEEAWQQANAEGRLDIHTKAKLRLAATNNAWSAIEVVDKLYHAAGGTAIYSKSKLQQCFRDVHIPTQHLMVAQPTYEVIGRVQLGMGTNQPL
jgi:alkylation response protein AidB-like acyl-CoA dehydrogenase